MIDRKRQKGYILRSISRARSYLDDAKKQSFSPDYNRGINYKRRAKDEMQYVIETLTSYFT